MPQDNQPDFLKAQKEEKQETGFLFPLRLFRKEDFPALFALDQLCFAPGIAYSQEDLRAFLAHPSSFTVVADDAGGKIAGFAILELYRQKRKIVAHIITLDVHPDYRRRGLGRELMTALAETARASGADLLRLEVSTEDEGAQAFYARMGFSAAGRLKRYYLDRIDAFRMERALVETF